MGNQQDEYNKSYAQTRFGANHNETHNPNTMAEMHATGSLGGRRAAAPQPSAPASPRSSFGQRSAGRKTASHGQATQAKGDHGQSFWALAGVIGGFLGAAQLELGAGLSDDMAWIAIAVPMVVGGVLGYKFHKGLTGLAVIGAVGAAIYFFAGAA